MHLSTPLIITFCIYLFCMIGIGLVAYFKTKNFDDFILGGRSLGSVVTALSAGASDMSGWLLMGLPGAIYLSGLSQAWIGFGCLIGAYLNWRCIAARLRIFTEIFDNSLTLPDYFTSRFEDHQQIIRACSALIILVFFIVYCASGMVAGGQLFHTIFEIDYSTAVWVGAIVTIAYTFIGGFLAVSWTDTIQATLMLLALIITPIMVIYSIGSPVKALQLIQSHDQEHLSFIGNLQWIEIVSLLAWSLGYLGQPHILARFMAAESAHSMVNARRIGMTWMVLCLIGTILIGLFGYAYFQQSPNLAQSVNRNSERIFIELTFYLFNPWIGGVLLSAILAAVMSTLSCQLLVTASALTEDLYKSFFRPKANQNELVWIGRGMILLVSAISMLIALNPDHKILGLVEYAWAGFGASFGPVVAISLFWSRMTKLGAIAGMLSGGIAVMVWHQVGPKEIYEIIPGFIISSGIIVLISYLSPPPSEQLSSRFERAVTLSKAPKA